MSNTVMRAMMIGLVAMLGAKAEAHYVSINNKVKYCDFCINSDLVHEEHVGKPLAGTDVPAPHDEKVEFCVKTKEIDLLCAGRKGPEVRTVRRSLSLSLEKPIISPIPGTPIVHAEGRFEDFDPKSLPLEFCRGVPPLDKAIIRAAKVTIKTFARRTSPRSGWKRISLVKGDCTLSKDVGFPELQDGTLEGTPYDCSWRNQNDGPDEADGPNNDGPSNDGSFDDSDE